MICIQGDAHGIITKERAEKKTISANVSSARPKYETDLPGRAYELVTSQCYSNADVEWNTYFLHQLHTGDERLLQTFLASPSNETVPLRCSYSIAKMTAARAQRMVDIEELRDSPSASFLTRQTRATRGGRPIIDRGERTGGNRLCSARIETPLWDRHRAAERTRIGRRRASDRSLCSDSAQK